MNDIAIYAIQVCTVQYHAYLASTILVQKSFHRISRCAIAVITALVLYPSAVRHEIRIKIYRSRVWCFWNSEIEVWNLICKTGRCAELSFRNESNLNCFLYSFEKSCITINSSLIFKRKYDHFTGRLHETPAETHITQLYMYKIRSDENGGWGVCSSSTAYPIPLRHVQ